MTGNFLFPMSLETCFTATAISKAIQVGLVFFIPGHNQTVRVNGGVRVIDGAELQNVKLEVHDPDEKARSASRSVARRRRVL